ncbi:MAG: ABC transporter permease [Calditrichae bacterium]|nr:ABC transporter permease [Calditrichota bacterium]MCB9058974.1 ABC transporter permease [Calditrichia bacterium]
MYLKLAWKNVWRNKKRTLIVSASVFFAVILSCLQRSAQIGSFDYMVHSITKIYLGVLQVQHKNYWENRSLDDSIVLSDSQKDEINKIKNITSITPRIESVVLISGDSLVRVAHITGIDPHAEDKVSGTSKYLQKGEYFSLKDGALIASGLAERLKLSIGDSLLIYGLGFHGQTAAALLPVTGILKFPIEKMNTSTVYINIKKAADIFGLENRITSLAVMIDDLNELNRVSGDIHKFISSDETVLTWEELLPEIKQTIQFKTSSNFILIGILYIVIAFGIFGVVMMMTLERETEYGILNALGMKKRRMFLVTFFENVFLASIGTLSGIIAAIPVTTYLAHHPIQLTGEIAKSWEQLGIEAVFSFSADPSIFVNQAMIIFIISFICLIYPMLFLSRLKIVKALKK